MNIIKNQQEMDALFALLNKFPVLHYKDRELDESWNNVLLLDDCEAQLLTVSQYTISDILYSKYYWCTKFMVLHKALYGTNAGMEDYQFSIIESMDHESTIDMVECCYTLEAIEQELGYQG